MTTIALDIGLHPKQLEALHSEATEVLYGGAAGGGKSHFLRVLAILICLEVPAVQAYLFHRVRGDVIKTHMESPKGIPTLIAPLIQAGLAREVGDQVEFLHHGSGYEPSRINLCHCKDEKNRYDYLSAEIHVLLIDELTTFTETIYRFLRNRVRAIGLPPGPGKLRARLPLIVCSSNPGNVGHAFVKDAWVGARQPLEIARMPEDEGGMLRQFIPAVLEDNPSLLADDPGYVARLSGLGSPELVRAYRYGDWDVIAGAFYPELDRRRHMIEPFAIPDHWLRFVGMDWGYAEPSSVGWYAVSDGMVPGVARGALVRYREWYTCVEGRPNTGTRLDAEEQARGILIREGQGEVIRYRMADPSMHANNGGPSLAERMYAATNGGVDLGRADNTRSVRDGHLSGHDQIRARLRGNADGAPMLQVFSTCHHWWRTMPTMQHDETVPERMMDGLEDHCEAETRYALLSRPYVAAPPEEALLDRRKGPTFAELIDGQARQQRGTWR